MKDQELHDLQSQFPSSSWAIWSEEFPDDGCPESDPERWIDFVQSHRKALTPSIVFLSLNPAGEQPDDFRNFHSPKHKHHDDRLKAFIQENQLEALQGGYMTDLVIDEVTPESGQITPEEGDVERFLDQLDLFRRDQYNVISFSGKAFEALKRYFGKSSCDSLPYNIRTFTEDWKGREISVYRVWFFGNWGANADKVSELQRQLVYLNGIILKRNSQQKYS